MSYSTRLLLGLTLLLPLITVPASAQKSPQSSDYERFITAISTDKIEAVQAEIDKGSDINARDKDGGTPLWHAAHKGSPSPIVELLLDHGAQIEARDNTGVTALMAAVDTNQLAVVKLLLDRGAQVNARDDSGVTALMRAAKFNRSGAVKLLLDRGAQVNARDRNGVTPLMFAVHELGFPGIVTLLIERGAEVDARSNSGSSPLHRAAQASTKGGYQAWFFNNACDTDYDRVRRGAEDLRKRSLQITQLLLDTGAQVDARDENGNTPLTVAAKGNVRPEIIQLLIEKGAEVNALNNDGSTPLIVAAQGAGTQFRDWNNHLTPFHIVELLLDKGANPLAKDASGMKAIDYARNNKALENTHALNKLAELSGE